MKKIAVTMGEPGGIGPEVALKAVAATAGLCRHVLVGDAEVLEEAERYCGLSLRIRQVKSPLKAEDGTLQLVSTDGAKGFKKAAPTAVGGKASALAIEKAVELAVSGQVDAVVTAPISKEALRMAGLNWPGHTEMLASLTGTDNYAMMLAGGGLRVVLVTIHKALKDVAGLVTQNSVLKCIRLARQACSMLSIQKPRIAVAALNPHAGESGMFGSEEEQTITPAVHKARREGIPVSGPFPADTLFYRASLGEFDMVVSMYHDQGLIPIKLMAFDKGVNVTIGLPIIRTSPDHGTAYDIAWTGVADSSSMVEAIKLAVSLKLPEKTSPSP